MGNRFPSNGLGDGTAADVSASASEKVAFKEREVVHTKMTTRLAIKGLNWSYTSVTDVFQVFSSMLQDPSEILSIKLYHWKVPSPNKTDLFGVADFRSVDSAKTAFEKINSVELSEKSGMFILEVIPDDMTFENPVEVCNKCNLSQPENNVRERAAANGPL